MRRRKLIIASAVLLVLGIAWYWFRPELLFIDHTVHEELPGSTEGKTSAPATPSTILATGRFHSVAHQSQGVATVHRLADGNRVLRFTEFATSNGPDVHVYLVAAGDARDNATVTEADFIDLGSLKGNKGDQNYELPTDVDLGKYRSVTIWCKRFSVNFATAPLNTPKVPGFEA
jgi:hypothetical protein